jgi:hypothetical protein
MPFKLFRQEYYYWFSSRLTSKNCENELDTFTKPGVEYRHSSDRVLVTIL